jgi:hypothetical protein
VKLLYRDRSEKAIRSVPSAFMLGRGVGGGVSGIPGRAHRPVSGWAFSRSALLTLVERGLEGNENEVKVQFSFAGPWFAAAVGELWVNRARSDAAAGDGSACRGKSAGPDECAGRDGHGFAASIHGCAHSTDCYTCPSH